MHKSNGTCRIVFVFPALGIGVKIPIIQIGSVLKGIHYITKSNDPWTRAYHQIIYKWDCFCSIKGFLLHGVFENLHEYLFYLFFKKRFPIQPTYFSFFGLCNVVKAGNPLSLSQTEFMLWRRKIITLVGSDIEEDNHNFECPENFTRHGNDLFFSTMAVKKQGTSSSLMGKSFLDFLMMSARERRFFYFT